MKNKTIILWAITGICLILTVVFWFLMNNQEVKYEEVTAIVTSATSRSSKQKKSGSKTTFL